MWHVFPQMKVLPTLICLQMTAVNRTLMTVAHSTHFDLACRPKQSLIYDNFSKYVYDG